MCLCFSMTASAAVGPVESRLTPLSSVDLQSFSDRADAWTEAHQQRREEIRERAMLLALEARSAEESRAQSTTTAVVPPTATAPTTVPPTAVAPAATVAPTTVAPSTVPSTTVAPEPAYTTVAPTTTAAARTPPTPEQWEALRQCESSGNYRAISVRPRGAYRGAYQFSRTTWDWVAPRIGADHLVGVDPVEASPQDQDRMALALWEINGWSPWPACSRRLGYL